MAVASQNPLDANSPRALDDSIIEDLLEMKNLEELHLYRGTYSVYRGSYSADALRQLEKLPKLVVFSLSPSVYHTPVVKKVLEQLGNRCEGPGWYLGA